MSNTVLSILYKIGLLFERSPSSDHSFSLPLHSLITPHTPAVVGPYIDSKSNSSASRIKRKTFRWIKTSFSCQLNPPPEFHVFSSTSEQCLIYSRAGGKVRRRAIERVFGPPELSLYYSLHYPSGDLLQSLCSPK
jgi:hypothetical protein